MSLEVKLFLEVKVTQLQLTMLLKHLLMLLNNQHKVLMFKAHMFQLEKLLHTQQDQFKLLITFLQAQELDTAEDKQSHTPQLIKMLVELPHT